jgi:hypothetical protein
VRANELIRHRRFERVRDISRVNGIGGQRPTEIPNEGLACVT